MHCIFEVFLLILLILLVTRTLFFNIIQLSTPGKMPHVNANWLLSDGICSDLSDVAWHQWLKLVSPWHRAHSSLWYASLIASIHTVYEQASFLYQGQSFNSVYHLIYGSAWTVHLLSFSFEHKATCLSGLLSMWLKIHWSIFTSYGKLWRPFFSRFSRCKNRLLFKLLFALLW